jgi:hypothetical protein
MVPEGCNRDVSQRAAMTIGLRFSYAPATYLFVGVDPHLLSR